MKKVFVLKNDRRVSVEEAKIIRVETVEGVEAGTFYNWYTVLFDNGEIEEYFEKGGIFDTREEAEAAAARENADRDEIDQEAAEDAREWMWA